MDKMSILQDYDNNGKSLEARTYTAHKSTENSVRKVS